MYISSRRNSKIKSICKLKMKKHRNRRGQILIEGYYPLKYAYENNYPIEELFICERLFISDFDNKSLIQKLKKKDVRIWRVSESVFSKISSYRKPSGLVAVAAAIYKSLKSYTPPKNGLFIVAESVEDPHHLGELIRIADATGSSAVIVADMRTDLYHESVIRSSHGAIFSMSVFIDSSTKVLSWLKNNKIQAIATSPAAHKKYIDIDMKSPTAVVIGTEYGGLTNQWLSAADKNVVIPMKGKVDSLSVTASAAVILYEALRQRLSM